MPRDPDAYFDYLADFSRHFEWATNPVEIAPAGRGSSGAGARFRAVGRRVGKDWPSDLEVTGYDRQPAVHRLDCRSSWG